MTAIREIAMGVFRTRTPNHSVKSFAHCIEVEEDYRKAAESDEIQYTEHVDKPKVE